MRQGWGPIWESSDYGFIGLVFDLDLFLKTIGVMVMNLIIGVDIQ